MFALVDCNNFYASCERVFRPDLNGKPVVVLSNNDGCVIARSNEAKEIGIPMGAPAFEYEALFKKHQVHVFSANFVLYGDMSKRVVNILRDYTPELEIYSVDEAFLKLSGFEYYNLQEYAHNIKTKVKQYTGIPVCVGVAQTKALSKLANLIAKKYTEKTNGVYIIDNDDKRIKALKWLKIGDVWGVGKQLSKKLLNIGVKTAYDFTQLDDGWIKKNMAVVGLRLQHDLQGIPTIALKETQQKKSITTTRTFETNYTEFNQINERVVTFAVLCAEKLRKQNLCCNAIDVFVLTNRHRKDLTQYNKSISIKLPYASSSNIEIARFATEALKLIFKPGYQYKKAGVVIHDFSPANNAQVNLFNNANPKHIPLMKVIDKVNLVYGTQKIRLGSQDQKRLWKMKQEKLSPQYTTKLSDIITIHV